jgi:lipopolysaccharide biosynthesis glycosyltransferase
MDPTLHIAISCDHNYLTPFYVLLTSLFDNNKCYFSLHIIITGINQQEREKITSFVKEHHSEINFYDINEQVINGFPVLFYIPSTQAIYYRLFFPIIVPSKVDRLLYLDTDIVVVGNLEDLFKTDLGTYPVAAVADTEGDNREDLGIVEKGEYFNSGVLLIDVKRWRSHDITEKALRFVRENPTKILYGDQDALNGVLVNNWNKLPSKYNIMFSDCPRFVPKRKVRESLQGKVLVHFTSRHKPWSYRCANPYKYLYHSYLSKSPARKSKGYADFSFTPACLIVYLKLKVHELYYNLPLLVKFWRTVKVS